ncbi:Trp biosynthesis-associated membrane protein [Egibacter rhizosphaerae]|uniref:Trp biosynthesis-associated membrane protein n=1 Tax=Egibacter rhizosphaerae TaxID=1670831 RepID=UPI0013F16B98|nr:Trp biosynthesis-associated membrane protein [Egibacter rhizosphaerae]
MRGGRGLAAVALVVAGGVALIGSATADWVTATRTVDIGEVPVPETRALEGTAFAPLAVVWGVLATVSGIALAAVRGRLRRLVGLVTLLVGVAAGAGIARGTVAALGLDAAIAAGPGVGALGVVAVLGGGALAARGDPAPRLSSRFDLGPDEDGEPGDEWALAGGDDEERAIEDRDDPESGTGPGSADEPPGGAEADEGGRG